MTPHTHPRLRVVHVCGGTLTGCTRVVLDLLRHHDANAFEVGACFFSVQPVDPRVSEAVTRLGIPWDSVVKRGRYNLGALGRLTAALRRLRPDVVALHGFGAYAWAALSARRAGARHVIRVEHSPELHTVAHRVASRVTAPLCDSTVLVSQHLSGYLASHGTTPRAPEVIYNGVNVDAFSSVVRKPFSDTATPVVLMVARLDVAKDHATLLQATALLKERGVPIRLRLVGSGPLEGSLRAQALQLGIVDQVEFLGQREEDLARLLSEADLSVLSTHYEGLPLSVLEAMAAGRPVVATHVTSLPELVEHGIQGLLVPHASSIALADAIGCLVADPERARAMGEAGRARVTTRFSLTRAARAFEDHVRKTARVGAQPLRVLHVITDLEVAGAETVLVHLTECRDREGIQPAVAYLTGRPELEARLRAAGAQVFPLGLDRYAQLPGAAFRLAKVIRKFAPHVVHTHLLHAEILGGLVGKLLRVPVIGTVHNLCWDDDTYSASVQAVYRRVVRANDHTVAVIKAAEEKLRSAGVPTERLSTIANGIAAPALLPRDQARATLGVPLDAFVIGAVGNLTEIKNHQLLLTAFAALCHRHPHLHLVIIGAGPLHGALLEQATALGILDRVQLPGRVANAATFLAAFDLYVLPSRTEGASMSLLEALAAGLPTVATAVGGTPGLVGSPDPAALLVPANDAAALEHALERLVLDDTLRARLSRQALLRARPFTAEAMTRAYERLYLDTLRLPSPVEQDPLAFPVSPEGRA